MQGELKIHFCSDTCFSMPAALDATYDANVAADWLGLPFAPGKTLHGLLRDTWLTVRDTLDKDKVGFLLLGKPYSHAGEGLLRIGDARVEAAAREWIEWARERPRESRVTPAALRDAFLLSRVMTSEDRTTGAPKQDTLRNVRMVPAGTVLIAPLTLKTPHPDSSEAVLSPEQQAKQRQKALDLQQELQKLLELLAKLTRHVGLDRNRGLGHVRMEVCWDEEIANVDANEPDDNNDTAREAELRNEAKAQNKPANAVPQAAANGGEVCFLPLRLKLTAPCLLADRAIDPNSRATKSFITGAALRGAVADALIRGGATEDELREILISGTVRFLNAYPAQQYVRGKYRRSLPPPLTWQRVKDATLEDWRPGAHPQNLLPKMMEAEIPDFDAQMTNLSSSFFAAGGSAYAPVEPKRRFSTHQQRDRARGMATKQQATVFVYEALEADQTFLGAIAVPASRADLQTRMRTALAEPLWLGRSLRSGYGGAPIVALEEANWNTRSETGKKPPSIPKEALFQVRLTSDAILRDPNTGQHDPWQLKAALQAQFTDQANGVLAIVETVCVAAGTAQGYNSLWRTELPALPCVQTGSVALLRANVDLSTDTLAALQSQPIGERVAEGRGCFVIETEVTTGDGMLTITEGSSAADQGEEPTAAESETLMNAQKRLYLLHLRRLLGEAALQIAESARSLPKPSVLQRMRAPLGEPNRALDRPDPWRQTYIDWMGALQANKAPSIWYESIGAWRAAASETLNLSPPADRRLREKASKALSSCYLQFGAPAADVTLAQWLQACALIGRPPLTDDHNAARQQYQITSNATSERLWNKARAGLTLYFLDTLLNRLARKAKGEAEPNVADSTSASANQPAVNSTASGEGGNDE